MNWSFILKHLLSTSSKLKKQLQRERQQQAALASVSEVEKQRDNGNSPLKRNNNGTDVLSPLDRYRHSCHYYCYFYRFFTIGCK